jgi:hypothetical protein
VGVSTSGDPCHGRQAVARSPASADKAALGDSTDRWATIRYAIDSTGRTVRLCVIMLVAWVLPAVITLLLGVRR